MRLKRESGRPCRTGSSQAIALTSATCSGGKTARASRARSVLQPLQTFVMEAPSPATDDPRRCVQASGDVHVAFPCGCIEDDLGALHLPPGKLLGAGDPLELQSLPLAQLDLVTGRTCHCSKVQRPAPNSCKGFRSVLTDASTSSSRPNPLTAGWSPTGKQRVRARHRGAHLKGPRRAKPRGRPQAPDACASLRQSPAPTEHSPTKEVHQPQPLTFIPTTTRSQRRGSMWRR